MEKTSDNQRQFDLKTSIGKPLEPSSAGLSWPGTYVVTGWAWSIDGFPRGEKLQCDRTFDFCCKYTMQHCGRICPENDTVYFPIKPSYRCDNIAQTNCRNTCH